MIRNEEFQKLKDVSDRLKIEEGACRLEGDLANRIEKRLRDNGDCEEDEDLDEFSGRGRS